MGDEFFKPFPTENERSILMKGLNFSVTPSKIPVADIVAATEYVCSQLSDKSQADSLRSEVVKVVSESKPAILEL